MQTGNTDFIYRYDLDKACFQHDMAFGKSKDSANRNHSDRFLRDKAFQIMSDTKYDGYQRRLASMVFKFFVKKSTGSGVATKYVPNNQLANELHKELFKNSREKS